MLRITNGEQTLIVSKGAFKELYSLSGWAVVEDTPAMLSQESTMAPRGGGGSNHTTGLENPSDGHSVGSGEDDSQDGENILKNMSEVELKQYASLLGIKTKTLKTREELMEAIKAHKE